MNHTTGETTYDTAALGCYCKSANCKTQCGATLCAASPAAPDTACNTCLDNVDASMGCDSAISSACGADPDCVDFVTCANACPM
ncbi:MAG TPA: hypothetical protein VIF62_22335 [Labilithrix sp.]|jgi:hypothetical protein